VFIPLFLGTVKSAVAYAEETKLFTPHNTAGALRCVMLTVQDAGVVFVLHPKTLAELQRHRWPGNVRELQNAIERAVLMAEGPRIKAEDLSLFGEDLGEGPGGWCPELPPEGVSLREVERELVLGALRRTRYVQKDAAALLGISRRKLNYMIQRMGITHDAWRRNRKAAEPPRSEP